MTNFSRTLSNNSIVEWFRLVELFSILSSILISVGVLLSSPAGTIPEGRVHHVTRAIIQQRLSRAVQIRFILNVLVNMHSFFFRELFRGVSVFEDGAWLCFWVDITRPECRFVWLIF